MKSKRERFVRVRVELVLPARFRWVARQPYGAWAFFPKKPWIQSGDDGWGNKTAFWAIQEGEYEIDAGLAPQGGQWRKSAKRLHHRL